MISKVTNFEELGKLFNEVKDYFGDELISAYQTMDGSDYAIQLFFDLPYKAKSGRTKNIEVLYNCTKQEATSRFPKITYKIQNLSDLKELASKAQAKAQSDIDNDKEKIMSFDLVLFEKYGDYYSEALETEDDKEAQDYAAENDYETIEYYKKDDKGDYVIYEVYGEGVARDSIPQFMQVVDNMALGSTSIADILDKYKDNLPELIEHLNEDEYWLGDWGNNIIYGIYKQVK